MERAQMNYESWSRIIDSLLVEIASEENAAATARCFLETARQERARYPAPEMPGKDNRKKNVREV